MKYRTMRIVFLISRNQLRSSLHLGAQVCPGATKDRTLYPRWLMILGKRSKASSKKENKPCNSLEMENFPRYKPSFWCPTMNFSNRLVVKKSNTKDIIHSAMSKTNKIKGWTDFYKEYWVNQLCYQIKIKKTNQPHNLNLLKRSESIKRKRYCRATLHSSIRAWRSPATLGKRKRGIGM